ERLVRTLFRAVKPDPIALEFVSRVSCLAVIGDEIRLRTGGASPANISQVMAKVNELLDESIAADGFDIRSGDDGRAIVDLAKINLNALEKLLKTPNKKNVDLEHHKPPIRAHLKKMIHIKKTRENYLANFKELFKS